MPWVEGCSELHVQLLNDRNVFPWITTRELAWFDPVTGKTFIVPKYFRTDGASIPMALSLVPIVGAALCMRFFGKGIWQGFKQGVLHDCLRRGPNPPVPADVAHRIFRDALIEAGYPDDLVENYYAAVASFNS